MKNFKKLIITGCLLVVAVLLFMHFPKVKEDDILSELINRKDFTVEQLSEYDSEEHQWLIVNSYYAKSALKELKVSNKNKCSINDNNDGIYVFLIENNRVVKLARTSNMEILNKYDFQNTHTLYKYVCF